MSPATIDIDLLLINLKIEELDAKKRHLCKIAKSFFMPMIRAATDDSYIYKT